MPVIVITGVSKRLGLALAEHFLALGYKVVGNIRSFNQATRALQSKGIDIVQCDLTIESEVTAFIQHIKTQYKQIDVLIHNASEWLPDQEPFKQTIESMMNIHAVVPYTMNMALTENLCANSNIIHITDYVANTGSDKHMAYAASKAALENLTLSFAKKLAPKTRVNAIAPALLKFNSGDSDEYKTKAKSKNILHKEGGFASAILSVEYLINNDFITGRILPLDGGRHLK